MIDLLRPFRALAAALRRWLMRRAARRLLAAGMPRGLPAPPQPFRLALRVPGPLEPTSPLDYWTLPFGAQVVRGRGPARLLRLSALPPPPRKLDVLVELSVEQRPLTRLRLPPRLRLLEPLQTRVQDLGVGRPALFRLDAELRLPAEVDPLRLPSDAPPPAPERRTRPRTPLARAPLHRVRPRNFRLDPRTGATQNEGILPQPRDTSYWWVSPSLRREKIDLPWMAREHIAFLGPLQAEWFNLWWFQSHRRRSGGRDPREWAVPRELFWQMEECKEQMLIRRDAAKDEQGPDIDQELSVVAEVGPVMADIERDLAAMVPEKEWVDIDHGLPEIPFERGQREAVLLWRTLVGATEER